MSDKDAADKAKEVDKAEDFEKRYKDSQDHIATIERENAAMRDAAQKDKELLDTVTQYVDWEAVNGTKKSDVTDGETLVDQKTLQTTVQELKDQINRNNITNNFRVKFPDMVEYEDLVGVYLQKTDARRPMDERIAKAVESTRKLLESERTKGRKIDEKEKEEKAAKEAKAAGLATAKGQKGSEEEPEGESYDEYVKGRKAQQLKNMGL
jgi:hypothetical protein